MGFRTRSFTDEQLIAAVKNSISKREVLIKLSLVPAGANYRMINILFKRLNINTAHFLGKGHLKGKKHHWGKKILLKKILIINSKYTTTNHLKHRLIKEKVMINECVECGITEWRGKKLSLHLDHINGTNNDNRISNLRLLCPNCHSLTPTYCRPKTY